MMRTGFLVRAMSAALCVLVLGGAAGATEGFKQDRFAIGLWVDPPMDAKADARYKELAEANFTLLISGFSGSGLGGLEKQFALCEKYDLRLVAEGHGIEADALPDNPICWGYKVKDEPNTSDFPMLRARVDAIRAALPGKLAYINLFPGYASPKQLGAPTYDAHVKQFIEEVRPGVLSMDHYPMFRPGRDGREGYCNDLAVMRKYSLEAGIPFWNFFNTMPFGSQTDPTESQLRWQIYSSLAYGAKGVLYFCYYTPLSHEFPKGGAIIQRDNRRTRHYYQARRTNEQIKNLGPTFMQLTSIGVHRVSEDAGHVPAEVLKGLPITDLSRAPYDPTHDYLLGVFKHADGRRAVLLNNYRFAYTAWPTVVFDAPLKDVVEIDKWSGEERPIIDDSPDMDGLQVSLDSGEGRLFLLPAK
jgi:hypothetical protein